MEHNSPWSEIRNTYFDTTIASNEGDAMAFISIDAWRSEDDAEQGSVIAQVALSKHGDVIVSYNDNLARKDEAAQESIQDAIRQLKEYYQEQKRTAPAVERNQPDELVVRLAHYAGEMEAKGRISPPEWDDLCSAIQTAMDLYYNNPSETNPFHIEDIAEKVFLEKFPPELQLHSFYYTFGTSITQPFYKGYLEIRAEDRKTADALFRSNYPDKIPGFLNCSSIYDENTIGHFLEAIKTAPDWGICHRVITQPEPAMEPQYKQAVLLTCVHEHSYGFDLDASVHANDDDALAHVDSVKEQFEYEEGTAGESFDADIQTVIIDITKLKDVPNLDLQTKRTDSLADKIQAAEGKRNQATQSTTDRPDPER